jgi:hypothetical protein
MVMGLRPLDLERWLEIDAHRDEELALKSQLLSERRDVVVATRPEGDDASAELYREVLAWFASYASTSRWRPTRVSTRSSRRLGWCKRTCALCCATMPGDSRRRACASPLVGC